MASKRMIARKVALSKKLSAVKWHTECLYYRGLPFLDDAGRLTADPEEYRGVLIPLGKGGRAVPLATIEASINELYRVGLIGLCECPGKRCMEYRKFDEFNTVRSDRTPQVDCPAPIDMTWYGNDTPAQPSRAPAELKGKEVKGIEGECEAPTPALRQFIDHWAEKIGPLVLDTQTSLDLGDLFRDFSRELPPGAKPAVDILCAEIDELAKRPPKNRNVKYFAAMMWGKLNE